MLRPRTLASASWAPGWRTALAAGVTIGGLSFGGFAAFAGQSPPPLTVTVTANGTLQPAKNLSLNFDAPGRLTHVYVSQGQSVVQGQLLAQIDPSQAQASLKTTLATLASANAQLLQLKQGLTPAQKTQNHLGRNQAAVALDQAEVALKQTKTDISENASQRASAIKQAETQLAQAQRALAAAQATANSSAASVVGLKSQIAAVQSQLNSNTEQQTGLTNDLTALQDQLQAAQNTLQNDQTTLQADQQQQSTACTANPNSSTCTNDTTAVTNDQTAIKADQTQISNLNSQVARTHASLGAVAAALTSEGNSKGDLSGQLTDAEAVASANQGAVASDQTQVDADAAALQTAQDAARTGTQTDATTLQQAKDAVVNARLSLSGTIAGNTVKAQGPLPGELTASRAAVSAAKTAVANARAALAATTMRAPTAGTIADINGAVGEMAGASNASTATPQQATASGTGESGTTTGAGNSGPTTSSAPAQPSSATSGTSGFITLVDLNSYDVTATFADTDVTHIRVGQAAKVSVPDAGVELSARVTNVDPLPSSTGSTSADYDVQLTLEGTDRSLRPGMAANVTLTLAP
jgi:multidrug efflux pump subunit AcrA (membrane-fusion protein)